MFFDFLLFDKMNQRNCIKFWVKTFEMLTVEFVESTISRTQIQLCYNQFKEGREDVNDDAYLAWPSKSTTGEIIAAVHHY